MTDELRPCAITSPAAAFEARLRAGIRDVPDYPSPGVLFKDITPLLANAALFAETVTALAMAHGSGPEISSPGVSGSSASGSSASGSGESGAGESGAGASGSGESGAGGLGAGESGSGESGGGVSGAGEPDAGVEVDVVAGIEARGFIFGAPVALALGAGFVPIRKVGKLPYSTVSAEYALEYGSATIEVHTDAIKPGQRVLLVDDVLATGGTAEAAARLLEDLGAEVVAVTFLIELGFLNGRQRLPGRDVRSLVRY